MLHALPLSRRTFLRQSAVAASSLFAAPAILRGRSLNERLNLAFIGAGGRGGANLRTIMSGDTEYVVALCDVNARNLGSAGGEVSQRADLR